MAKNKNKGFSLIEIVIAIAILTILLTPILRQLAQTMATNRRSKEQQHATENAVYIMEYFQKADKDAIDAEVKMGFPFELNEELTCTNAKYQNDVECEVWLYNSTTNTVFDSTEKFKYYVSQYELADEKIGSRQTTYTRLVTLDDLSNKLMACDEFTMTENGADDMVDKHAYKIALKSDMPGVSGIDDFVESPEGYLVKYHDPAVRDYITAIVCKDAGKYEDYKVQNPNETNLGNMHDLNADKMAIIDGDATDADEEANKELYAKALAYMKEVDPAKWEIQVGGGSNYLIQDGYMDGLKKLTHIYVDEVDSEHYRVKVLVSYTTDKVGSILEMIAYDRTFAYADCPNGPEIYFEYQPLVVDDRYWNNIEYAANEYILLDNYVEGTKLYLYKPRWDAATIYMKAAEARAAYIATHGSVSGFEYNFDKADLNDDENYHKHTSYLLNGNLGDKVKIHLANAVEVGSGDDKAKQVSIFTNLDIENVSDAMNNTDGQFVCKPTFGVSLFDGDLSKTERTDAQWQNKTMTAFDYSQYLKYIEDDVTYSGRLYTITVKLTPDDTLSGTVEITGAKGAN